MTMEKCLEATGLLCIVLDVMLNVSCWDLCGLFNVSVNEQRRPNGGAGSPSSNQQRGSPFTKGQRVDVHKKRQVSPE